MFHSHCHSLKSFYDAPPLSAIIHDSNSINFEDGFCLPSSCHSRTWLLDNFQDICSETTSCQLTDCEQDLVTKDTCVQRTRLPKIVQTTYSNSRSCERTTCQSERSSAMLKHVSQPCQSGRSQQVGSLVRSHQPASYMAKCSPPKTPVSKSCQTLGCESSQCQSQSPEYNSCRLLVNVVPEPQLLESSSIYEPTCCVTGGLQLPSK
ncbi:PREDICTED: keratin-associated protein 27-1 [Galeopterus variegatus]|uniref:Keratin-associated protein n=1 Tax=Galeopterus variegatus TaxID=482537 RepID=A0ABM0QYG9_GALVR|nr:PREDICTED: keratin-associated protein 27-1 [Galeopterus variegatus]